MASKFVAVAVLEQPASSKVADKTAISFSSVSPYAKSK